MTIINYTTSGYSKDKITIGYNNAYKVADLYINNNQQLYNPALRITYNQVSTNTVTFPTYTNVSPVNVETYSNSALEFLQDHAYVIGIANNAVALVHAGYQLIKTEFGPFANIEQYSDDSILKKMYKMFEVTKLEKLLPPFISNASAMIMQSLGYTKILDSRTVLLVNNFTALTLTLGAGGAKSIGSLVTQLIMKANSLYNNIDLSDNQINDIESTLSTISGSNISTNDPRTDSIHETSTQNDNSTQTTLSHVKTPFSLKSQEPQTPLSDIDNFGKNKRRNSLTRTVFITRL